MSTGLGIEPGNGEGIWEYTRRMESKKKMWVGSEDMIRMESTRRLGRYEKANIKLKWIATVMPNNPI